MLSRQFDARLLSSGVEALRLPLRHLHLLNVRNFLRTLRVDRESSITSHTYPVSHQSHVLQPLAKLYISLSEWTPYSYGDIHFSNRHFKP
jgi:hypothetical protein